MEKVSSNFDVFEYLYSSHGARHYDKNYDDPKLQNAEICAACGGACCKRCGCFLSPDDFSGPTYEAIAAEIEKGYISIEIVDLEMIYMDGFAFIVHVRNVGDPIVIGMNHRPEKACILLSEHGCRLDWEHRPAGGKLLIPTKGKPCDSFYGLEETVREWKPYQRILAQLSSDFRDKDIECVL